MAIYNVLYKDGAFGKIELGDMINKGGAAGKIYLCNGSPLIAKIFHDRGKSSTNRQKLQSMMLNRPVFPPAVKDKIEYTQISWPEAILEDGEGFCVGYLMPLIHMDEAVSLDHLMQKAIRKKLGLPEKYAYRIFAAYNVASMVSSLHNKGHYIVDLKPSNVSVYKDNMMVAMVDCDGFSINGETTRYPAEFVSEEYIYPEGMELSCAEMGEEQDKFALAVIIFKLLNNGIHPFSGTPRTIDDKNLTIQQRIEGYHYAYGLWPDPYQAPHPYSIHEYFDKKTLELFERAFTKGHNRPTALEWQEHLRTLLHGLKTCKKDPHHSYFTGKGCGLCIAEQRFSDNMNGIRNRLENPQTIRGMELSALSVERVEKDKIERIEKASRLKYIALCFMAAYLALFTFLFKLLEFKKEEIASLSFGLQALFITLATIVINKLLNRLKNLPILNRRAVLPMLKVYAFACLIIAALWINDFDWTFFALHL